MGISAPSGGDQQVGLNALPHMAVDDQAPLSAFGGGDALARSSAAIRGAAEDISGVAHTAYEHANQLKVLDADNQMNMFEVKQVYDPNTGALTKRGTDAFNLPETVMKAYDETAGKIAEGLQNDEQRISFQHLANSRRFMLERVVGRHVDGEIKSYNNQVTQDSLKNSQDMAVANYSDPDIVAEQIAKQRSVLTDFAARNGIPLKVADKEGKQVDNPILSQMMTAAVSTTHEGVIRQFAENGLSEVANKYLTKNKAEMTPRDAQVAEDTIRRRLPQDVASRIYDKRPTLDDGSADRQAAQKLIDATPGLDAEQKLAAFSTFEAFANKDDIALDRTNKANATSFYSKVTDMDGKGASIEDQKKLADKLVALNHKGVPDQYDLAGKYAYIDQLQRGPKGIDDVGTATDLWHGLESGQITDPATITQARQAELLSLPTYKKMVGQIMTGTTVAMRNRWTDLEKRAETDFATKPERDNFMSELRSEFYEKPSANPDDLNALYDKRTQNIKTGASKFFGMWSSSDQATMVAQQLRQSPQVVSAVGGTAKAIELAQNLGGPERLAAGTPYGDAALALRENGKAVTTESIKAFVKNNPSYKR